MSNPSSPDARARLVEIAHEIRAISVEPWDPLFFAHAYGALAQEAIGVGALSGPEYARLRGIVAGMVARKSDLGSELHRAIADETIIHFANACYPRTGQPCDSVEELYNLVADAIEAEAGAIEPMGLLGWDRPTYDRNKFCYDEAMNGTSWKGISKRVREHSDWERLNTIPSVKRAATEYAKRAKLAVPPKRRRTSPRAM